MNKNLTLTFTDTNLSYSQNSGNQIKEYKPTQDLILWKGDNAYIATAVIANCDLKNLSFEIENQSEILFEFFQLQETQCFIGHAGWYAHNRKGILPNGPKKLSGDILYHVDNFDIKNGEQKAFWIAVKTPKSIKANVVSVKINIKCESEILDTLNLNIKVLDYQCPTPSEYKFKVEYWQHPYNIADYYNVVPFSPEHLDILKKFQKTYFELGGFGVTASIVEEAWGGQTYRNADVKYPSMIKWSKNQNGKFEFDFTDFDKWVSLNEEVGLHDKIICYSLMPWGSNITYFDKNKQKLITEKALPSLAFLLKKYWTPFLNAFIQHLDEKNWFERIYIGFDERFNMNKVLNFLSTFKNKSGKKFKVSASFNNFLSNKESFDMLDYASVGLDESRENATEFKAVVAERNAQNKETSIYTATDHYPNSFALSLPAESYWTIMYAHSTGCHGFLRWAFDAWVKDPLNDTTHCSFPAGDCFLIYPTKKDDKTILPIWSVRLAKLDEGVRDINKIYFLNEKYPDSIAKTQEIFDTVKSNYSNYQIKDNSWGVSIKTATWADDLAKSDICADMDLIKKQINELFIGYLSQK